MPPLVQPAPPKGAAPGNFRFDSLGEGQMRILVVEDDPALRLGLCRTLQAEGWQVDAVTDGEFALSATATTSYDAAVLDLGLPRRGGLEVLQRWRRVKNPLAVIILTASDGLQSRLRGLNEGADDYLAKPFEPEELVARLRAVHRRRRGIASNLLTAGELRFNTDTRELYRRDERLALSPREAALLELLMSSPGSAVPKQRIISAMSSWEADFSANLVEIYVLKLRRKLSGAGVNIATLRGIGYALEVQ